MKHKSIFLFTICIVISGYINAQSHYISPFYSYSFGLNPLTYSAVDDKTEISQDTSITYYTYHSSKFSLGKGQSYGVIVGGKFIKNISFDIGLSYFIGKEHEIKCSSNIGLVPYSAYNVDID
ncbi:MAG: hypothetical protein HGB12_06200, partial [Bacteroidetes bacterium]|nr:hypothetical protein [Bacteroidota bacterium]